jgi:class 3 adenylate cyclase
VALALADAHARGVIHRDLKPSNIMIDSRDQPILMDFGLARRLGCDEKHLTQLGTVIGTPAYMPPEQVTGDLEAMGPASDIYSLGVILYQLLTGQLPFQGNTALVLAAILNQDPPRPLLLRGDLDPTLEAVCLKAMSRQPGQRFASMLELASAVVNGPWASTIEYTGPPAAAEQAAPAPATVSGQVITAEMVQTALNLLSSWGLSMGLRKLKFKAQGQRKRAGWQLLSDWLAGETTISAETLRQGGATVLDSWRLASQALAALRERDYRRAHRLLRQAVEGPDQGGPALRGTLLHIRASVYSHEGKSLLALRDLQEALQQFGKDHFMTGRVLDTLGMVYASKTNFHLARAFYEQALLAKEQHQDEAGLAVTHGQLGRLFLNWDQLDEAEQHFRSDLRLAEKMSDPRSEAQMHNHLGQVALARAQQEAASNRKASVRRYASESAGWLASSIRLAQESQNPTTEAFARKDMALVFLLEGSLAEAEEQAAQAETLFRKIDFSEGLAQVNFLWGMVRRLQGRYDEATRRLKSALGYFDSTNEKVEAVRALWELARTQRDASSHTSLVARAFEEALVRAEQVRRGSLVEAIEAELREVDHEAYYRHLYRRVRGQADWEDTAYLGSGESELATVLVFDLQGFTEATRGQGPRTVLVTFNQVLADLEEVLQRHRAQVLTYVGDGFLAILRQAHHAERAVQTALDLMAAVEECNRPRTLLGQPPLAVRISINTGNVFLGNVGTYHKMDFTAVGPAVSLAARLLTYAEPGKPCLSESTHELVGEQFAYPATGPRTVAPQGSELLKVWDVLPREVISHPRT